MNHPEKRLNIQIVVVLITLTGVDLFPGDLSERTNFIFYDKQ